MGVGVNGVLVFVGCKTDSKPIGPFESRPMIDRAGVAGAVL